MTIRTAKQLRENLGKIQADNKIKLDRLNAVIFDRLAKGQDTTQARTEYEQAERVANKSEELAEKALQTAEARESTQAQENEATRQRMAAEQESRQKFRAERAQIAAGFPPAGFAKPRSTSKKTQNIKPTEPQATYICNNPKCCKEFQASARMWFASYCSNACRQSVYRARKKAEAIEQNKSEPLT